MYMFAASYKLLSLIHVNLRWEYDKSYVVFYSNFECLHCI